MLTGQKHKTKTKTNPHKQKYGILPRNSNTLIVCQQLWVRTKMCYQIVFQSVFKYCGTRDKCAQQQWISYTSYGL